ncbi:MAG: hypothetical protein Q8T08_07490, partial [Ignavibacteria bacterium]|nr:hypothetical protein [Ignavibacteria bacterium]
MLFKYGPYWLEEQKAQNDKSSLTTEIGTNQLGKAVDSIQDSELFVIQNGENEPIAIETNDKLFQQSISLLFRMFLVSLLLGFAWNYPFQRYFRLKRRGKPIGNQLLTHCKKWLLKIPLVNSLILGFGFITTLTYMFYLMINTTFTSAFSHRFFEQFFYVATFASFLTVLFVFFWFRHRVRFIYLEHVYDSVSLYKSTTTKYRDHIVKRLWINSIMTTLLPLVIVIFYLS